MVTLLRHPVVLMYHGFTTARRAEDRDNLLVEEGAFKTQLRLLQARRFDALDLDGYLRVLDGATPTRRSFLFTADDGFRSFGEIAAPLLAAANIPAVLFVLPALLGGRSGWLPQMPDEPLVDADELRDLVKMGVEIGAHGLDHTSLVGLSDAELLSHTAGAREQLADLTGTPPRAFAYPFGAFDRRARLAVEKAGFQVAFSVFDDVGRYAISRVDVNTTDTPQSFRFKLVPGYRRWWRAAGRLSPARSAVRKLLHMVGRSSQQIGTRGGARPR